MSVSAVHIESLLAGTQCRQCGYPSCAAYAEAIVNKNENINLCRPGGMRVQALLSQALHQPAGNLHQAPLPPQIAEIKEKDCIGCTLCLQICPTGAIIGATKHIHNIVSDLCTGCGLCLPVCPADCITTQPAPVDHKLTHHQGDGSLTAAASTATWALVHAQQHRQRTPQNRAQKTQSAAQPVALSSLSEEMAAKIAAARQKAQRKYAEKGPLPKPKTLKKQ